MPRRLRCGSNIHVEIQSLEHGQIHMLEYSRKPNTYIGLGVVGVHGSRWRSSIHVIHLHVLHADLFGCNHSINHPCGLDGSDGDLRYGCWLRHLLGGSSAGLDHRFLEQAR